MNSLAIDFGMENEVLDNLVNRFNHFYDSILKSIFIDYENDLIGATFHARDYYQLSKESWGSVRIELIGIQSFKLQEKWNTHQGFVNGIHLVKIDNNVVIEFGELSEKPVLMEDLEHSSFYIISKSMKFEFKEDE